MWSAEVLVPTLLCILLLQLLYIFSLRQRLLIAQRFQKRPSSCPRNNNSVELKEDSKYLASQNSNKQRIAGVAITVFLGSPQWWQNRYSMMVNQMLAALPDNWVVQIYFNPAKKMAVQGTQYMGILRQIEKKKVFLTEVHCTVHE